MTEMKFGGIVLTGIGAYLVLNKLANVLSKSVAHVSDSLMWRAYYKCKRENPIPPHYTRTTAPANEKMEGLDDMPPEVSKQIASSGDVGKAVGKAIVKAVDSLFNDPEAKEEAIEGDLEASCDASKTPSEMAEDIPTTKQEEDDDK